MVLHGIALYCIVLHGIARYCMVLHVIAGYYPRNRYLYVMLKNGARLCKIVHHAIPCNTMQYHTIPCNTMQYHASLITADGAYHCPVGSIMAILSSTRSLFKTQTQINNNNHSHELSNTKASTVHDLRNA